MLSTMSADELWRLHEMLCEIVVGKMQAEKAELERKLVYLNRQHSDEPATRDHQGEGSHTDKPD